MNRTDLRKIGGAGGPNRACRPDYVRPDFAKLRAEYRAALARWQALNLRDYTFEYEEIAAPLRYPATVVTVEGGRLKSVVLKAGELGEPSASARLTMSGRFLETWADLAQAQRWPCPVLEVSYDARYGFPQRRYIGTAEALVADGDAEWRITSFTPLRPVSARP